MTFRACRLCGRDLPAESNSRRRYCPDRNCKKRAKVDRRKTGVGETRKVGRRNLAYVPGHPLAGANGLASVKRVGLYEQLAGADPRCATCSRRLDWAAPGPDPGRVCAMTPPGTCEVVALCRRCLTGVGVAAGCLGRPLHPLAWAEACDSQGAPVEDGGPLWGAGAAAHGLKVDARLHALWDGSESHADQMAVTATLLALRARRKVAV